MLKLIHPYLGGQSWRLMSQDIDVSEVFWKTIMALTEFITHKRIARVQDLSAISVMTRWENNLCHIGS